MKSCTRWSDREWFHPKNLLAIELQIFWLLKPARQWQGKSRTLIPSTHPLSANEHILLHYYQIQTTYPLGYSCNLSIVNCLWLFAATCLAPSTLLQEILAHLVAIGMGRSAITTPWSSTFSDQVQRISSISSAASSYLSSGWDDKQRPWEADFADACRKISQ